MPTADVCKSPEKIALVFEHAVAGTRIGDIEQMDLNRGSVNQVICIILSGSQIHLLVNLTGIGADDFPVDGTGQAGGKGGFPPGCGSGNDNKVNGSHGIN